MRSKFRPTSLQYAILLFETFGPILCTNNGDPKAVATVRLSTSIDQQIIISGLARVDRRTKRAVTRLRPGEIAVIDHADIDAIMARSLIECKVSAVINAQPFVSGRYPNRGPEVLSRAGIPTYELPDPKLFDRIHDGNTLNIDVLDQLTVNDQPLCNLRLWDEERITSATADARGNLSIELERFARNTLEYLEVEGDPLVDLPAGSPANSYGAYQGSMSNHDKMYEHVSEVLTNGAANRFSGHELARAEDRRGPIPPHY